MSNKKKVLVVDDDPDMLRLMSSRLKKSGFEVAFATDGVSCMSEVRKQDPDLILLDLGLPAGDGFKTLERLRGQVAFADIPVVVLTGQDASDVKDRAMEAGATDFFEKTANKDDLLAAVWRLTDEGESLGAH